MNPITVGQMAIFAIVIVSILGGVFADAIARIVRMRVPGFAYQGSEFLIRALLLAMVQAYGLVLVHLWLAR